MAKQLATVGASASIPSLPRRLAVLAGAVGTVQHPGQPTRYHLQIGWAMSDLERKEAATLHSILISALDPMASFDGRPGPEAKGALLTKMIRGLGGAADMSDLVAAAKVEMYADAIDVVPAWAIDLAIKRWGRGACPVEIEERPNYNFPPSPAALRKMALHEITYPKRDAERLTILLAAIPIERALDPEPLPKENAITTMQRM